MKFLFFLLFFLPKVYGGDLSYYPQKGHQDTLIGDTMSTTYTIANKSKKTLTMTSMEFSPGIVFSRNGGSCSPTTQTLRAGEGCTLTVAFAPKDPTIAAEKLVIGYYYKKRRGQVDQNLNIPLIGKGISSSSLRKTADEPLQTLEFPSLVSTQIGSKKNFTFQLVNRGSDGVRLDSWAISDPTLWGVQGGSCLKEGVVLISGASCTVEVSFIPNQEFIQEEFLTLGYTLNGSGHWRELIMTLNGEGILQDIASAKTMESEDLKRVEILPIGANWKFEDKGADLGTLWMRQEFDDSLWPSVVLNQKEKLGSAIWPSGRPMYLRHQFKIANAEDFTKLFFSLSPLQGLLAAVYLNGTEIYHSGIASNNSPGPLSFIGSGLLRNGTNILAVKIEKISLNQVDSMVIKFWGEKRNENVKR